MKKKTGIKTTRTSNIHGVESLRPKWRQDVQSSANLVGLDHIGMNGKGLEYVVPKIKFQPPILKQI